MKQKYIRPVIKKENPVSYLRQAFEGNWEKPFFLDSSLNYIAVTSSCSCWNNWKCDGLCS